MIEGSWVGNATGVGRYSLNLAKALSQISGTLGYQSFGINFLNQSPTQVDDFKSVNIFPRKLYYFLLKRNLAPPIDWFLGRSADAYLFTDFVSLPLSRPRNHAVVVYDLSFLECPQYVELGNQKYLEKQVPRMLSKNTHVITISNYMKKAICNRYELPSERVTVAPPAIDPSIFYPRSEPEIDSVRKKFALPESYLLFVGTIEPRKNLTNLIAAHGQLDKAVQSTYPLVVVGGKGWLDSEIDKQLARCENVLRLGFVEDEELAKIYSGATLFIYPSRYEGFGIPPLEALACGAPSIVSNATAIPEVVGNAALQVSPDSVDEIRSSIINLLKNPDKRKELREAGFSRARHFRWSHTAQIVDALMNRLAN